MTVGTIQINSGVCPNCGTWRKLVPNSVVWGAGNPLLALGFSGLNLRIKWLWHYWRAPGWWKECDCAVKPCRPGEKG